MRRLQTKQSEAWRCRRNSTFGIGASRRLDQGRLCVSRPHDELDRDRRRARGGFDGAQSRDEPAPGETTDARR